MAEQRAPTRIGRPVLVAVLAVAAVIGAGIGLLLASIAPPAAAPVGSSAPVVSASIPSPSPSSIPTTSPSPIAPPGGVVLELSGTGNLTTDAFAVEPGWQVVWQTEGTQFAYSVHGAQDLGEVARATGPSSGANAFAPAGTFRIEIAAAGPWSIKVLQGGQ